MPSHQRRASVAPPDLAPGTGHPGASALGLPGMMGNSAMATLLSDPRALFDQGAQGGAAPLPFRAQLEASFGRDLGHIQVHQGEAAAGALAGLDAGGASAGGHVLLPQGAGLDRVAHEVAHALQGEGGGGAVSSGTEPAEREADQAADAVRRGQPAAVQEKRGAEIHRFSLGGAWDSVKGAASDAWNGATDAVSSTVSTVKDAATGAASWTADKVSDAADWTKNKVSEGVSWVGDKANDVVDWGKKKAGDLVDAAKEWGTNKLVDGLSWAMDRYDDTYAPALDKVRGTVDSLSSGAEHVVDGVSGKLGDALDWVGWNSGADKVRGAGDWLNGKVDDVRDVFGLDEKDNSFTHYMEIPSNSKGFVQQYSELGVPLTDAAWKNQDAIDGGKLHALYNKAMLDHLADTGDVDREKLPEDLSKLSDDQLQELTDRSLMPVLQKSGVLQGLVDDGTLSAKDIPESWDDLSHDQITDLAAKVRSKGADRALLDAMKPDDRTAFQEKLLDTYMDMANNDPNAAMILDLMPTETDKTPDVGSVAETLDDALLKGQEPNDFVLGERTGLIRTGSITMAKQLQETQGASTYGLVVPYANTVDNILFREGKPTDAAENVHKYLSKLDKNKTAVLDGYSQGAGGVQEYLREYGSKDGLDYAVSLAPMGGPTKDSSGGDGMWAGDWDGVQTLALSNKNDPAQYINGDNIHELGPGLLNFVAANKDKKLGGDSDIHSGFDEKNPGAGTYGYPMAIGQLLLRDLFSGQYQGDYQRRGDWDYDLRTLGDQDWEALAAQYR